MSNENLSKLSAFFRFCSSDFATRRIFAEQVAKSPNFFRLFSCQKSKGAVTQTVLPRTFALPLQKLLWFLLTKTANFHVSGAETAAPAFIKSFYRVGLSRRVSVDNSYFQNSHTNPLTDFG
jgi:hypothetical protein